MAFMGPGVMLGGGYRPGGMMNGSGRDCAVAASTKGRMPKTASDNPKSFLTGLVKGSMLALGRNVDHH